MNKSCKKRKWWQSSDPTAEGIYKYNPIFAFPLGVIIGWGLADILEKLFNYI